MSEFILQEDPFASEASITPNRNGSLLDQWRSEILGYAAHMTHFENMDPIEVFLRLSGYSARATEMRTQMYGNESNRMQSFRTRVLDPFIEETDRQFKLHSRIQAIRELEFKMSGGGV